jgi:hypothetical protein
VTPITAGHIEELSARRYTQHPFQELYLRSGLFWTHDTPPDLERDTAKKINLPVGLHFFSFKKTHVTPLCGLGREGEVIGLRL